MHDLRPPKPAAQQRYDRGHEQGTYNERVEYETHSDRGTLATPLPVDPTAQPEAVQVISLT
jgi:hypothetical protein